MWGKDSGNSKGPSFIMIPKLESTLGKRMPK